MKTPLEINHIGYKALMEALGFDGTMRFLRQFEPGRGDYTMDRRQWLDALTLEEVSSEIERHTSGK
jgi:hypothetical protein